MDEVNLKRTVKRSPYNSKTPVKFAVNYYNAKQKQFDIGHILTRLLIRKTQKYTKSYQSTRKFLVAWGN